jgi:hypothetical protein
MLNMERPSPGLTGEGLAAPNSDHENPITRAVVAPSVQIVGTPPDGPLGATRPGGRPAAPGRPEIPPASTERAPGGDDA